MIESAFLAEVKARTLLSALIGQVVPLKPSGRGEWRGLCPFHAERTPSFYVIDGKGFWHCFGCGKSGDAVRWVLATSNARDFPEAVEFLARRAGLRVDGPQLAEKPIARRPMGELRACEERRRIAVGRAIWAARRPLAGSPAARYLAGRRLRGPFPPTLAAAVVSHPHLDRRAAPFPALIAAMQGPDGADGSRHVVGAHCTFLPRLGEGGDAKGRALPPSGFPPPWMDSGAAWKTKIMRGVARASAVRLTAPEALMVIGEGIETTLSVLQALWDDEIGAPHIDGEPIGAWAALSQANLGTIWLPGCVREVILCADGDGRQPDAADGGRPDPEAIVAAAASRHSDQGRAVRVAQPPAGCDFNDLLADGDGNDADSLAAREIEAA